MGAGGGEEDLLEWVEGLLAVTGTISRWPPPGTMAGHVEGAAAWAGKWGYCLHASSCGGEGGTMYDPVPDTWYRSTALGSLAS